MSAPLHEWNLAPKEAMALQLQLARRLELTDRLAPITHIAGVDIGFEEGGEITRAAVVVLKWDPATAPDLSVVEQVVHREPTRMPYIPGLLSFREIPAALGAFEKLSVMPELVMVDGQGIAHPRRLGVAAHLGLWLDLPTIGIAKSRLYGQHARWASSAATGCRSTRGKRPLVPFCVPAPRSNPCMCRPGTVSLLKPH